MIITQPIKKSLSLTGMGAAAATPSTWLARGWRRRRCSCASSREESGKDKRQTLWPSGSFAGPGPRSVFFSVPRGTAAFWPKLTDQRLSKKSEDKPFWDYSVYL